MNIMLMSRFERHEELAGYAKELEEMGHIITSRWLNPEFHHTYPEGTVLYDENGFSDIHAKGASESALIDMEDTLRATCGILFTEHPQTPVVRNARQREFGMAMGYNIAISRICQAMQMPFQILAQVGIFPKRLILCGPRENIYDCLEEAVERYPNWESVKLAIGYAKSALTEVRNELVGPDGRPL